MDKIVFYAYGHKLIKATHKSTLEITKDNFLTERGDCIIGINSSMSCSDLPDTLKNKIMRNDTRLVLIIEVDGMREYIFGYGDMGLSLTSSNSMVIRKSTHIDDRTLMIKANKSAKDISRRIINKIRDPKKKIIFTLVVL